MPSIALSSGLMPVNAVRRRWFRHSILKKARRNHDLTVKDCELAEKTVESGFQRPRG